MFKKVDVYELNLNPFQEINKNWTLISANKDGVANTMTASWGAWGILWGKETVTVYIRQSRFTKEFVDGQDYFTVSLFDGHKKELGVLGTRSGRDGDKIGEVGFHLVDLNGQPGFEEATYVFVCRKMYQLDMPMPTIPADVAEEYYGDGDFHTMYIGEIVACYKNE